MKKKIVKKVKKAKKVLKRKMVSRKRKIVVRKPVKKSAKKAPKAKAKKKVEIKKTVRAVSPSKPIGEVTHFFTEIGVAIVVFKQNIPAGTLLYFRGATTDFKQLADSMQLDHVPVAVAKKGKQVGIKVKSRVREGDKVHKV
jgi:hypothetical protein